MVLAAPNSSKESDEITDVAGTTLEDKRDEMEEQRSGKSTTKRNRDKYLLLILKRDENWKEV